jgi:hypothetical protein
MKPQGADVHDCPAPHTAMTLVFFFALVTATFRPAQPTVGDLVTIQFQRPVVLDRSNEYEVVAQSGSQVIVRTFQPRPFMLSGTMGEVRFRNLQVPVRSVLKEGDNLAPAPLRPPREMAYERRPFVLIALAAAAAIAVWFAVIRFARRMFQPIAAHVDPVQRFRSAVIALRGDSRAPRRWAALADATRAYLAATDPSLGAELTTTQLLAAVRDSADAATIATVLQQGDLEKFSPWGAAPADFDVIASSALQLAREPAPPSEEAA